MNPAISPRLIAWAAVVAVCIALAAIVWIADHRRPRTADPPILAPSEPAPAPRKTDTVLLRITGSASIEIRPAQRAGIQIPKGRTWFEAESGDVQIYYPDGQLFRLCAPLPFSWTTDRRDYPLAFIVEPCDGRGATLKAVVAGG